MGLPTHVNKKYYMLTSPTSVTNDPGSKPDQIYARQRDKQNYIRKTEVYIQDFPAIRILLCIQYIGSSISTVLQVGSSVGAVCQKLYTQSKSAPEDGRIRRPKHVGLI